MFVLVGVMQRAGQVKSLRAFNSMGFIVLKRRDVKAGSDVHEEKISYSNSVLLTYNHTASMSQEVM